MNVTDTETVRTIALEKLHVAVRRHLSTMGLVANEAKLDVYLAYEMDALCLQLRSYVLAMDKETHEVKYPASWRDAFKERWFPQWALRRWPVVFVERSFLTTRAVCPHLNTPEQGPHLQFFVDPG